MTNSSIVSEFHTSVQIKYSVTDISDKTDFIEFESLYGFLLHQMFCFSTLRILEK